MKLNVITFTPSEKKSVVEAEEKASLRSVQKKLGLNGQTFVCKVNSKIAHPETLLKDGDTVEFIGVIYGG